MLEYALNSFKWNFGEVILRASHDTSDGWDKQRNVGSSYIQVLLNVPSLSVSAGEYLT